MDTLSKQDVEILTAPFPSSDHEFLRGYAYIQEDAITRRIEDIDPAWCFHIRAIQVRDNVGTSESGVVTVHASLTIKGATRESTGMASITLTKDGSSEANEAEKSATTDALKRCARLFGIGRYLLNLPSNVKDAAAMAKFLGESTGKSTTQSRIKEWPAGNPPKSTTSSTQTNADAPAWREVVLEMTAFFYGDADTYVAKRHENSIDKMIRDGAIKENDSVTAIRTKVFAHRLQVDYGVDESDIGAVINTVLGDSLSEHLKKNGTTWQGAWNQVASWLEMNKVEMPD